MTASFPCPSFGLMITSIAPPVPLAPRVVELLSDESEKIKSSPRLTVPNVYEAPADSIVVSEPAV